MCTALLCLAALCPPAAAHHTDGAEPEHIDPELLADLAFALDDARQPEQRFDATVWLHWAEPRLVRHVPQATRRMTLLRALYAEAHRHQLDPGLILAIIQIESAFDRFAVSRVGAQGIMQIMPFWKGLIGREDDNLMLVAVNVRYGTAILAHYLKTSNGDMVAALARYNGSTGKLRYPEKVIAAWRQRWQSEPAEQTPDLQRSCSQYDLAACRD